jgi:hypothetical protein
LPLPAHVEQPHGALRRPRAGEQGGCFFLEARPIETPFLGDAGLGDFEDEHGLPDADHRRLADAGDDVRLRADPVDGGTVAAPEIRKLDRPIPQAQGRVTAGNLRVDEHDRAVVVPAEHDLAPLLEGMDRRPRFLVDEHSVDNLKQNLREDILSGAIPKRFSMRQMLKGAEMHADT